MTITFVTCIVLTFAILNIAFWRGSNLQSSNSWETSLHSAITYWTLTNWREKPCCGELSESSGAKHKSCWTLCRQVSRIISLHVPGPRELQAAIGHDPKAKYKIKLLVTDVEYYNLVLITSNSDDVKFQSNHKDTLTIRRTSGIFDLKELCLKIQPN